MKKEKNVFQKGEEAVVKTAEKTADKSVQVYDKSKEKVKEGWEKLTGK